MAVPDYYFDFGPGLGFEVFGGLDFVGEDEGGVVDGCEVDGVGMTISSVGDVLGSCHPDRSQSDVRDAVRDPGGWED